MLQALFDITTDNVWNTQSQIRKSLKRNNLIYQLSHVNAAYLRCRVTDVHVNGENWLF